MTPLETACLAIYRNWVRYIGHDAALAECSNFVARYGMVQRVVELSDFAADFRCIKSAPER